MSKEKLVKIKMLSISSGPNGAMHKNKVYPVSETKATALVDGGYAEYETAMVAVKAKPTAAEKKEAVEAAKKLKAEEDARKVGSDEANSELDKARAEACKDCKLLPDNCVGVQSCEKFDKDGNPVPSTWK